MPENKTTKVLLAIAILAIGVLIWRWCFPPDGSESALLIAINQAHDLESKQDWSNAQEAWHKVLDHLDNTPKDSYAAIRREAKNKIDQIEKNNKEPVVVIENPKGFAAEKPPEVPRDKLMVFYPEGRTIRSVGDFNIQGQGTNLKWKVFKGTANFVYRYRALVETKVVSNDGQTTVEFEQFFKELVQTSMASEKTLALELPESPIARVVWNLLDENILRTLPPYVVIKKALKVYEAVDPNFELVVRSLTDWLNHFGVTMEDSAEVAMLTRLEALSGVRVKIRYVSGLGVTRIEVLEGKNVEQDILQRLAVNSSLLMDYFLSQGDSNAVGSTFEVKSSDVAGIVNPGFDVEMDGVLKLKVGEKTKVEGEEVARRMELDGGSVNLRWRDGRAKYFGTLVPESGFVEFDPGSFLVRRAKGRWHATSDWISTNHLLFETKGMQKIRIDTYYEAFVLARGKAGVNVP